MININAIYRMFSLPNAESPWNPKEERRWRNTKATCPGRRAKKRFITF
jgi:hypothetical protein